MIIKIQQYLVLLFNIFNICIHNLNVLEQVPVLHFVLSVSCTLVTMCYSVGHF